MAFDNEIANEEQVKEGAVKATAGNTFTIGYDVSFADGNKKTVTIGSYASADLPAALTIKENISNVNASISGGNLNTFAQNFISGNGASAVGITACTITNKTITIISEEYKP